MTAPDHGSNDSNAPCITGGIHTWVCEDPQSRFNGSIQHDISHQALQLRILVLKLFQALGIGQVHPAILVFPFVKRRRALPRASCFYYSNFGIEFPLSKIKSTLFDIRCVYRQRGGKQIEGPRNEAFGRQDRWQHRRLPD